MVLLNLFVSSDFTPWFEVCLENVKFRSQKGGLFHGLVILTLDWRVKYLLSMMTSWFDSIIFIRYWWIFCLEIVLDFVCKVTCYRCFHSSLYVLLKLSVRVLVKLADFWEGCERMIAFALLLQDRNFGGCLGDESLIYSMRTLEKALHCLIVIFVI